MPAHRLDIADVEQANFALFGMIALLAWIAFAVDIAFSVKTRDNLQGIWAAWRVSLGNANWLALGGAVSALLHEPVLQKARCEAVEPGANRDTER